MGKRMTQSKKARAGGKRPPERKQRGAVSSLCPVARECGGCQHVDVPYADQLAAKDARMAELFAELVGEGAVLHPILGMDDPFHYRNKVTTPFVPGKCAASGGREILTGMYAAGSHRVVPTDACLLENEQAQQAIRAVKAIMQKHRIAPYDEDRGSGFMRHVVVRVGHESGEVLVTLVTNDDAFPNSKAFCRELVRRCPFVTTVVQNVNMRQTNVILGAEERRLYGPGFILDTLCGLSFRISSRSFYQVNSAQTTVLYEKAIELAGLGNAGEPGSANPAVGANAVNAAHAVNAACIASTDSVADAESGSIALGATVIDAYCGTGTIGLVAAKRGAASVIGVDSVESAIRDARENAWHNGVENARFITADATEFMRAAAAAGEHVDVVLMDPPRAGSTEQFLDATALLAPARVVYVSCNPATQMRDLRHLVAKGYRVQEIQPIDMFPHTDHVETIVVLTS